MENKNWNKIFENFLQKDLIVSFDFDGTLTAEGPDDYCQDRAIDNGLSLKNYRLFQNHKAKGNKVIIVTARYDNEENREDVKDFCEHFGLEPEAVYFTSREWKVEKLLELGVFIHYDNDEYEIDMIRKYGLGLVQGVLVTI